MHNLPQTFDNENWHNWNGPLTQGIDSIVNKFLTDILQPYGELPTYSMLIAHLNTNQGGLGLLKASHKATPNFVISMMTCQQRMLQGFQINKDTKPIYLHYSIADLFDRNNKPTSDCLTGYFHLSHILHISVVPPNAPKMNTSKFLNRKFLKIAQVADSKHTVATSSQDNYTT
jgi:hypothetical protein